MSIEGMCEEKYVKFMVGMSILLGFLVGFLCGMYVQYDFAVEQMRETALNNQSHLISDGKTIYEVNIYNNTKFDLVNVTEVK